MQLLYSEQFYYLSIYNIVIILFIYTILLSQFIKALTKAEDAAETCLQRS